MSLSQADCCVSRPLHQLHGMENGVKAQKQAEKREAGSASRNTCGTSLQQRESTRVHQAWRPGEGRGCGERGAREAAPWGPADTEPPSWPDCVTSGLSLPSSVPRLPQQPSSLPRKPLHSVDSQPMAHRGSPVCCCFSPET
ncbi:hypothetical protein R6Z07F_003757 [Ovis aries]